MIVQQLLVRCLLSDAALLLCGAGGNGAVVAGVNISRCIINGIDAPQKAQSQLIKSGMSAATGAGDVISNCGTMSAGAFSARG